MSQCIEWQKYRNAQGYGYGKHQGKMRRMHRVAYCEANGIALEDIKGKVVRHTCDNPPCVNPDHLVLGTQQDNVDDCRARGRIYPGIKRADRVLDPEQVQWVRDNYKPYDREYGTRAMARKFGVSHSTIVDIVHYRKWKSL